MASTPILDLEQAPPEPARKWLAGLIGVAIGWPAILAIIILADQGILPDWHCPRFNGLLFFPASYVVIALHELGHLLGGSLVGLESGGIVVGGFRFAKSGNNWVFRFDWRRGIGGYFKPLSSSAEVDPARYAWMVVAGPLANLFSAAILGMAFKHYGNGAWDWIGSLLWMSFAAMVFSLIPYSGQLGKSDGARLWQLLRHPATLQPLSTLLALQTQETKGARPRDWDAQLCERMLNVDSTQREYLACQLFAYYRRLDEGDELAALDHLENALTQSARAQKLLLFALFSEAAFASAQICKRAQQARTWRDRASAMLENESLDVVDAAIAMCEGRYEAAIGLWAAARDRVDKRRLDSGLIRFAKERWSDYDNTCRTALAAEHQPVVQERL